MKIEKIQVVDDTRQIVYGEIFCYHDIKLYGFRPKWRVEIPPEELEAITKLIREMDKEEANSKDSQ